MCFSLDNRNVDLLCSRYMNKKLIEVMSLVDYFMMRIDYVETFCAMVLACKTVNLVWRGAEISHTRRNVGLYPYSQNLMLQT